MSSVNSVTILGRVGKQPEVRTIGNGTMVANFSVATSEKFKDKTSGEMKEQTEWHNIQFWGKQAEIIQKYVNKGDQIYIEGKLKTRSWEKEGVTRYVTEIIGNSLVLLGNKNSGGTQNQYGNPGASSNGTYNTTAPASTADNSTDDLPF